MAIRLSFRLRNADAVVANLRAREEQLQQTVREIVHEAGGVCRELVRVFCPVRTGFMRDHVRTDYSESGYAFATGWDSRDFLEAGLAFYPPFVIAGTKNAPAQDCLTPAFTETVARMKVDLENALRSAARRAA
jgi:hypothetical protein